MIVSAERPTEYRLTRKDDRSQFTLWSKDLKIGKWCHFLSNVSLEFADEYLRSWGVDTNSIVVMDGGLYVPKHYRKPTDDHRYVGFLADIVTNGAIL